MIVTEDILSPNLHRFQPQAILSIDAGNRMFIRVIRGAQKTEKLITSCTQSGLFLEGRVLLTGSAGMGRKTTPTRISLLVEQ